MGAPVYWSVESAGDFRGHPAARGRAAVRSGKDNHPKLKNQDLGETAPLPITEREGLQQVGLLAAAEQHFTGVQQPQQGQTSDN
jgi:hypothetical protein